MAPRPLQPDVLKGSRNSTDPTSNCTPRLPAGKGSTHTPPAPHPKALLLPPTDRSLPESTSPSLQPLPIIQGSYLPRLLQSLDHRLQFCDSRPTLGFLWPLGLSKKDQPCYQVHKPCLTCPSPGLSPRVIFLPSGDSFLFFWSLFFLVSRPLHNLVSPYSTVPH